MKIVETSYGNFSVYVNRLSTSEKVYFIVSFVDKQNKTHIIRMKPEGNRCVFVSVEDIPSWIAAMEDQFSQLINEEFSNCIWQAV